MNPEFFSLDASVVDFWELAVIFAIGGGITVDFYPFVKFPTAVASQAMKKLGRKTPESASSSWNICSRFDNYQALLQRSSAT